MFGSKARKIEILEGIVASKKDTIESLLVDMRRLEYKVEKREEKIRELSDKFNEFSKVSTKLEAAIKRGKQLNIELNQARYAHIKYGKDLASLNYRVNCQQEKIEKVLGL